MQTFDDWEGTIHGLLTESGVAVDDMLLALIEAVPTEARGAVYSHLVDDLDLR